MTTVDLLRTLHLLAAVFWVGGMAFAHVVLRPASLPLAPAERLGLWRRVMGRFLPLVGVAVVVLLGSGHAMVALLFEGFGAAPLYVVAKALVAWLMAAIYAVIVLGPARRLFAAVDAGETRAAAAALAILRRLVTTNLLLGTLVVLLAGLRIG